MPARRAVWSSWNYLATRRSAAPPTISYWMNRLQAHLPQGPDAAPLFVTLNPPVPPRPEHLIRSEVYEHPLFDAAAMAASAACGASRDSAAPGTAAPISAQASTKTGCSRDLPWPKRSAACAGPGPWRDESGRIHLPEALQA
jgi:predicted NAD/FAD-binding protein